MENTILRGPVKKNPYCLLAPRSSKIIVSLHPNVGKLLYYYLMLKLEYAMALAKQISLKAVFNEFNCWFLNNQIFSWKKNILSCGN